MKLIVVMNCNNYYKLIDSQEIMNRENLRAIRNVLDGRGHCLGEFTCENIKRNLKKQVPSLQIKGLEVTRINYPGLGIVRGINKGFSEDMKLLLESIGEKRKYLSRVYSRYTPCPDSFQSVISCYHGDVLLLESTKDEIRIEFLREVVGKYNRCEIIKAYGDYIKEIAQR